MSAVADRGQRIVIDLIDSEPEDAIQNERGHGDGGKGSVRTQRPAFMSPRNGATQTTGRKIPDTHYFTPETSTSPHASESEDSGLEEISAAAFTFNARKSRNGPAMHSLRAGNDDSAANTLADFRASQGPRISIPHESQRLAARGPLQPPSASITEGEPGLSRKYSMARGDHGGMRNGPTQTTDDDLSAQEPPPARREAFWQTCAPRNPLSVVTDSPSSSSTPTALPASAHHAPVIPPAASVPGTKRPDIRAFDASVTPEVPVAGPRVLKGHNALSSQISSKRKALNDGRMSTAPRAIKRARIPRASSHVSEASSEEDSYVAGQRAPAQYPPDVTSTNTTIRRNVANTTSSRTNGISADIGPGSGGTPIARPRQSNYGVRHTSVGVRDVSLATLLRDRALSQTQAMAPDSQKSPGRLSEAATSKHEAPQDTRKQVLKSSAIPELKPRPLAPRNHPFTDDDDKLLIHLKDVVNLRWLQMPAYFPGRTWAALQTRYSTKFSARARAKADGAGVAGNNTRAPRGRPRRDRSAANEHANEHAREEANTNKPARDSFDTPESDSVMEGPRRPHRRLTRRSEQVPSAFAQTQEDEEMKQRAQPRVPQKELKKILNQLRQTVSKFSCDRILRSRELGGAGVRAHQRMLHSGIRDYGYGTLGPSHYMNNASGDVSTVAWSPKGNFFAAGAVAITDTESMQYNKPRNLVIGDASKGNIMELADHQIARPIVDKGSNATSAMRNSQDANLFTTIQSVAFAANGRRLYTVSVDNRLNVYKVHKDLLRTEKTGHSQHVAPVDLLAVSSSGLVATGCRHSGKGALSVFSGKNAPAGLSASKVDASMRKFPSALRFGETSHHSRLLLAGFACEAQRIYEDDDTRDKEGETCLWDINTNQAIELGASNSNVFDVTWNPNPSAASTAFAVACGATGRVNFGMHSVVRLYAPDQNRARLVVELECPAFDINDVIYSPHDNNIIAAGSTDGKVYIWDIRQVVKDQTPLRVFEHGASVNVLPHGKKRWEADTGIRFLSWGADHHRLYSGSSDGIVKCWDPYRSEDEGHVRDVVKLQSAIMSGAFSPDSCSLLIGEDASRLNLLAIGNEDKTTADMTEFSIRKDKRDDSNYTEVCDSYTASSELLESGQVEFRPMGALPIRQAVQGPNYEGPDHNHKENPTLRERAIIKERVILRERAMLFQQEAAMSHQEHIRLMKDEHSKPCSLSCNHLSANAQDDIDAADASGRFIDRIPGNLRKTTERSLQSRMQGRNANCSICGGVARAVDDDTRYAKALCEKCNFSCFRCSNPVHISEKMHVIECPKCDLAWRVGVLGYELIQDNGLSDRRKEYLKTMGNVEVEAQVWELGNTERERQLRACAE